MNKSGNSKITRTEVVFFLLWFALAMVGTTILWNYVNTPGERALLEKSNWIANKKINLASSQYTLLMAVHPQCPCTKTSISNLKIVMSESKQHVKAYILFAKPSGFSEDWVQSDLWRTAKKIDGVTPLIDEQGEIAKLFGAQTSGQTYLYDSAGKLVFAGGITAGRGHDGNNSGMQAIIDIASGGTTRTKDSAVFGCSLFSCSTKEKLPQLSTSVPSEISPR